MSERSAELLLEDILESCDRILEYTKGITFEEFRKNYLVVDAVVRNFTVIGEAAGRIPDNFRINTRKSNGTGSEDSGTGLFTIILVLITRSSGLLLKIIFLN